MPNGKNNDWTPERVEMAHRLWREGKSASEIERALNCGISRSAVIGRVRRDGVVRSISPGDVVHKPKGAGFRKPKTATTPKLPPPVLPVFTDIEPLRVDGRLLTITDLQSQHCKWPIGDPRAARFGFCGRDVEKGCYCPHHAIRAFYPLASRRPIKPYDPDAEELRHTLRRLRFAA